MSRRSENTIEQDFEHPFVEEKSRRGLGVFAMLAILSIVGIAIWLITHHEETS